MFFPSHHCPIEIENLVSNGKKSDAVNGYDLETFQDHCKYQHQCGYP